MKTIGERLKQERERLGLTQETMAEHGGVLKRAQINYEKGERFPDAKYLAGVAEVGINVEYVLSATLSHQRPKKIIISPSKENPALRTAREEDVTYKLKDGEIVLEGVESYIAQKEIVLEQIDDILKKIRFTSAHALLKNTVVELVFNNEMTINAAEAMLIIARNDLTYSKERLEKERRKNAKD